MLNRPSWTRGRVRRKVLAMGWTLASPRPRASHSPTRRRRRRRRWMRNPPNQAGVVSPSLPPPIRP